MPLGSNRSMKKQVANTEKKIAKKLSGFATPGSGAFEGKKGDISLTSFLMESKQTWKDSIVLEKSHLVKIDREATQTKKYPSMVYTFDKIADGVETQWVLIPLSIFKELLDDKNS